MDNPDLLALAVVGDGEAETGPLEGSWKGISFLNPARDGAVLPILHLNGHKIAGPTVLGRKDPAEVRSLLEGHGYEVFEVEGGDLPGMHERFAGTLAAAYGRIKAIQAAARGGDWDGTRPRWPLIVLRSPKGWTGPEEVDGIAVTGTWRSHQVPLSGVKGNDEHLAVLDAWLRSYRPEELFDETGAPAAIVRSANPDGDLRMSASPHANGGSGVGDLDLPDFRDFARDVPDARDRARGVDPGDRRADARALRAQPALLPALQPRRDQQQPGRRRLRRLRPDDGRAGRAPPTSSSPATGGSWRCSPSTAVTGGSRATP